ncbi:hypothetical protein F5X97DRAFT_315970 [Nemania serpens]|nr:hypothetical protein F5X97DRAFT_315970 [Nemania serpens]
MEEEGAAMKAALNKTAEVVRKMARACPPTDEDIRKRCTYCENKGLHTCCRCKYARYCSEACQTKDWPVHRLLCSDRSDTPRPSPDHFVAILFPAQEGKPRLIWIEQFADQGYFFPIIDCWLAPYARYANMVTDMNVLLEEAGHSAVGHGLVMIGINEQPLPHVPVNESIMALGKPGQMKSWFGNQIIAARRPNDIGTRGTTLDHVNFRDFRHAVDLFHHHPLNLCVMNPERYPFQVAQGAISECFSFFSQSTRCVAACIKGSLRGVQQNTLCLLVTSIEAKSMATDLFLAVHCDGAMRRFESFGLSSRIETAIRQGPARQEWLEMEIKGQSQLNLLAKHMVYRMVKQNNRFCVHPVRNAGSVVVFDHLGSAIEPAQIEAINAYLQSISRPVAGNTAGQLEDRPDIIYPSIQGFRDFWHQWQGNQEMHNPKPASTETGETKAKAIASQH